MDEPTSSLTLAETARLHEIVAGLRADGVGVIYISHRLGEVRAVADRAVVLRDGANVGSLARDELTHDNMVRLMVGRDIAGAGALARRRAAGMSASGSRACAPGATRNRRSRSGSVAVKSSALPVWSAPGGLKSRRRSSALSGRSPDACSWTGRRLRSPDPAAAIRQGLFLVPEDRRTAGLVVEFSVRENVTLPALDRYATHGLVSAAKERVGVTAVCNQLHVKAPSIEIKTANLSGGNQQKVVLAKWLALGPKVLIVDEPTRGIDVGAKAEIYTLLRDLAQAGVAIVMISSDMEEILNMSDRVAVMHEGAITGTLARAECTEERIMTLAVG